MPETHCEEHSAIITFHNALVTVTKNIPHRAATNDYFDNRLVGRLLFRLID